MIARLLDSRNKCLRKLLELSLGFADSAESSNFSALPEFEKKRAKLFRALELHETKLTALISALAPSERTPELIARARGKPVTEDSLRMIDAFFTGYDLTFTIEAPQPIRTNSIGTLSEDRKTLTYSTSIKDLVRAKSDVILSVGW